MQGERLDWLADSSEDDRDDLAHGLSPLERREWEYTWSNFARPEQAAPEGDWRLWLILAGRGFGKTRAGAEWVRRIGESDGSARIALVAASLGEARSVMVEGESGILACCPPWDRPTFEPSLRRLTFASGAQATLYSAGEPESLRGPQHSHARRAGAEGIHRQRGTASRRPGRPMRGRGRTGDPTIGAGAGRRVAGRRNANRRFHRPCRRDRRMDLGGLALLGATSRLSRVRQDGELLSAFRWLLAKSDRAGGAERWGNDRRRGPDGARRHSGKTGRCGHFCDELK
jgi:hypothetical protein